VLAKKLINLILLSEREKKTKPKKSDSFRCNLYSVSNVCEVVMKSGVFYSDAEAAAVDVIGCGAFGGLVRTAKVGPDVVVAIPCPGRNGTLSGSLARSSTPIQP
jgi:hypothetical protein